MMRHAWDPHELGAALEVLARRHGGCVPSEDLFDGADTDDPSEMARRYGLEAVPVRVRMGELEDTLTRCAPALVRLRDGDKTGFLVIRTSSRRRLTIHHRKSAPAEPASRPNQEARARV